MEDASGHRTNASELREQERRDDSGARSCSDAREKNLVRVPVTRDEIAILRTFLSAEIDAIIFADQPLQRD